MGPVEDELTIKIYKTLKETVHHESQHNLQQQHSWKETERFLGHSGAGGCGERQEDQVRGCCSGLEEKWRGQIRGKGDG